MKDRGVTNMAASVRRRLLNLSQARGADYNSLLAQYAIERFLYRLSKSALAGRFVLFLERSIGKGWAPFVADGLIVESRPVPDHAR